MKINRIFVLALMALLVCLPVWTMAESMYISDILHHIDEDGTVSVDINGESSVIWLKESSQGQSAWIGLDNSDQVFENGSQFHVRWLSRQDAEWDTYYSNLDDKDLPIDWMFMLELGVVDSNGEEIAEIDSAMKNCSLYVQLDDNWDISNLEVCYIISSGEDEFFHESVTQMDTPDGIGKFVTFSTSHFSPYCVYHIGEYDSSDLPRTGDQSNVLLWSVLACISMFGMMLIANKRKKA